MMMRAAIVRAASTRPTTLVIQRIGIQRQCYPINSVLTTTERYFSDGKSNNKTKNDEQHSLSSENATSMVPSPDSSSALPAPIPINFDVACKIEGEESQICTVTLQPGQVLRAESGAMIYMTHGVNMETTAGSGGLSDGFKRMMTGQNMFISDFTFTPPEGQPQQQQGSVALGTDFPSKIIKLSLNDYDGKLICQRGAYLASNPSVNIEMEFTKKFTTGFFGGEGFILQSLTGEGDVFVKAGGTLVKKELDTGETIRISSGSLVAFTSGVEYDVETMTGFKNVMFGGEGLFITTLKGPGTVWLQGLPPDRMISEIARRVPSGGGIGLGIPIGMGGGGGEGEAAGDAAAAAGVGDAAAEGTEGGGEDMVAATDAAVEADRQATVASSGMMGDTASTTTVDPDSPSALFGDAAAAPEETPPPSETTTDDSPFGNDDMFASSSSSSSETTFQDDSSSFSTTMQDDNDQFQNEFNDETTFSTYDGDNESSESFDTGADMDVDSEGGGVGEVLKTLWDFFTDDD
mmetsp:Transcript_9938/g.14045  ORF Transcript_9938/g.14045 Transcript_9938/m.14045 type:complete len:519 (+) Transcript_9938:49-1605(+)